MSHVSAYMGTYRYGYRLGLWLKPPPSSNELSLAEALKIFGLDKDASYEEIRKRHRELGLQYHPDKCEEQEQAECTTKMEDINNAYEVLTNKYSDKFILL